jgi:hypothetical protein
MGAEVIEMSNYLAALGAGILCRLCILYHLSSASERRRWANLSMHL